MPWLKLKRPIAANVNGDFKDIVNTKIALNRLGYYPNPSDGMFGDWMDNEVLNGIRRFQENTGLTVDGVMRPGGKTETMINQHLEAENDSPATPGNRTPEIKPPNVDPNMPEINKPLWPKSPPYVDDNGHIILEGVNPKTGIRVRPPKKA